MKVEQVPKDPEEKRDFSFWWFVISGILLLVSIWAVFDESVVRRPWRKYQAAFNRLELQKLTEAKKAEEENIKSSYGAELEEIKQSLKKARATKSSAAYKTAARSLKKQQKVYKDTEEQLAFAKADRDESYYVLDHARSQGAGPSKMASLEKTTQELNARVDANIAKYKEAEKILHELEAQIKAMDQEETQLFKRREKIEANLNDLERKISGVKKRTIEIKQVVVVGLGDFGRVDRCQTCHMGIDRAGFEDAPQPFRTHPKKDEFFASHPPEEFGCTSCHHGQGRALSEFKAHAYEVKQHGDKQEVHYMHHWEEPMYRGAFMQSACNDCHGNAYRIKEADVYTHGNRLFVELGCHGCHLVDGYENLKKVGPDLRRLASKTNPEWLVAWIKDPKAYNPHTRMPDFRLGENEAEAVASYLWAHSDKDYRLAEGYPGRGGIEVGKEQLNAIGCRGCHVVEEEGRTAYDEFRDKEFNDPPVRDHGPQLTRIAEKAGPEWIYNWLRNPRGHMPETRMPSLRVAEWEARNITSYLLSLSSPLPPNPELRERIARPELIAQGEKIIRERGCYGCHNIAGYENGERIGPELTTFGLKDLNEVFFGYTLDKNAPEKVEETWEDWTQHKLMKPNIYDTDRQKHLMPSFNWRNPGEIEALMVFLKAQDGVKAKAPWSVHKDQRFLDLDQGRRLIDFYSCNACHIVEGRGGTIRAFTPKDVGGNVIDALAPPNLAAVGAKIQPAWLFRFLHQPQPVRPWLRLRMPSFNLSDAEFTALVRYFSAVDKVDQPFHDMRDLKFNPAELQRGEHIFSANQCTRCHVLGATSSNLSETELASKAPNLRLAFTRLRPDWIAAWLADPNSFVPGTRMPTFWDVTTAAKAIEISEIRKEIQAADSEEAKAKLEAEIAKILKDQEAAKRDIRAVRDYILSLER